MTRPPRLATLATWPERTELVAEDPELGDEDIRQALAYTAADGSAGGRVRGHRAVQRPTAVWYDGDVHHEPPPLTTERRLELMFDLAEAGFQMMRENLRRRYPEETEEARQARFRTWLAESEMGADPELSFM